MLTNSQQVVFKPSRAYRADATKTFSISWWSTVAALCLVFVSACQGAATPPVQSNVITSPTQEIQAITLSPTPPLQSTDSAVLPTQVLAFNNPAQTAEISDVQVTQTPNPLPLRFIFPTPYPSPESPWRPPGYPVPWAPTPYDHFYFSRPIAADEINWPLQDYRYGGDFFGDVIHTGVDIPAPTGTPVLAVGHGRVVWAGYGLYRGGYDETDPYGLAVAIEHDFGYQDQKLYTVYGHMSQIDVALGQYLVSGERLGLVGETGRVTGPHLHFEVRLGKNTFFNTRNPELWVTPPEGWGVLAGRVMDSAGRLIEKQPVILTSLDTDQNWFSRSYGKGPVIPDDYYQENLVIGDLPAGPYRLRIAYAGIYFEQEVDIHPGMVEYFYFYGLTGFKIDRPPLPGIEFTPSAP